MGTRDKTIDTPRASLETRARTHVVLVVRRDGRHVALVLAAAVVDVPVEEPGRPQARVAPVVLLFLVLFPLLDLADLRLDVRVRGHREPRARLLQLVFGSSLFRHTALSGTFDLPGRGSSSVAVRSGRVQRSVAVTE